MHSCHEGSAQQLRVVTDSKYVYDGATQYPNRWFLLGQHVTNRDLWEALRNSFSASTTPTCSGYIATWAY